MLSTIGSDILDIGSRRAAESRHRRQLLAAVGPTADDNITGAPGQFDIPNVPDVSY